MTKERENLPELLKEYEDLSAYDLYIWGTGNTAMLYQEGLNRLEQEGIFIKGYIDSNPDKWGKFFCKKVIFSPGEIKSMDKILVLIASPQPRIIKEIGSRLDSMNIKWRLLDEFILKVHSSDVMKCYDLLDDSQSKKIYAELLRCRIRGQYPDESVVEKEQYFSFGCFGEIDVNEVFVDCGSYVGDTIERYIWKKDGAFKKIIAFEPDAGNMEAMKHRLTRLKREWNIADNRICVYPYGISDVSSVSYLERYDANNGFGSKVLEKETENTQECRVVSLDEFLDGKITFLKADIESFEYKMLLGAQKTIRKYQPKIAVCIYHNAVDFYSIPLLLHEINPKYHFALRHYTHVLSDSVLYAYTTD